MNTRPNIVLVHGAWADGSSWRGVIKRLQADGYHVTAPQFPLTGLADDVARLRQVLDLQDGPVIVAGHSYGGQVMTALGADDFVTHFAADVAPVEARVMYAVQQPLAASGFGEVMGVPAWKTRPSWYLVAADDRALPPDVERMFADRMGASTVTIASGHLAMVSHPDDVAHLIRTAAEAVPATS
jgi:pimeloyl-ACP methyl ester carboxylesterase